MERRVVITGLGAVTPVGNNVPDFWKNLKEGVCGIERITRFDVETFQCQIAAEIKNFDPSGVLDRKEVRKFDLFTQYALVAAYEAWDDAKLDEVPVDPEDIGTIVGSGIGGLQFTQEQCIQLHEKGNRRVSPFLIPSIISNMAAGYIAIKKNCQGPCSCPVTACATGNNALGDAFMAIKAGMADVILAGGAEAPITRIGLAGFANMTALSSRNETPKAASIPFDKRRDGFVMGEGAGILILEELESAKKRGAKIYAEMTGYSNSCDAYHVTAPVEGGKGAARSMGRAVQSAGLKPEDIDYINAHGTSTPLNDKTETAAIKAAFGEHANKLAISSSKSMLGHMIGAAGAAEGIASVLAIHEGVVPPTAGYEEPDPECDLDYVPNEARKMEVRHALSNSNGFGGHNMSVVFSKYDG